ncbi:hypothetical protein, partial [uncultured Phocaeicola sp.]|uniref:hypothetical protein n=1 Tax=uncultured Phocaeicola sp. TaxID=990718 RepID=UPI002605400D
KNLRISSKTHSSFVLKTSSTNVIELKGSSFFSSYDQLRNELYITISMTHLKKPAPNIIPASD